MSCRSWSHKESDTTEHTHLNRMEMLPFAVALNLLPHSYQEARVATPTRIPLWSRPREFSAHRALVCGGEAFACRGMGR